MLTSIALALLLWPRVASSQDPSSGEAATDHLSKAELLLLDAEEVEAERESRIAAVLEVLAPMPVGPGREREAALLERAAELAQRTGLHELARDAWRRAAEHHALVSGTDQSEYLHAYARLAVALHSCGALPEARHAFEEVVAGYERLVPEGHPNLAKARSNLASAMVDMGETAAACSMLRSVVDDLERALPDGSPELADARTNLAACFEASGDLAAAHEVLEVVLATRATTLPEGHPDLLSLTSQVGRLATMSGNPWRGRELLRPLLEVYEAMHTPDDEVVLDAKVALAESLAILGELPESLSLLESVLETRIRMLGPDHELTARSYLNVGSIFRSMGRLSEARSALEKGLEGLERALPPDDPNLLDARLALAYTMQAMGEDSAALAIQREVMNEFRDRYPEEHSERLRAEGNVATTLYSLGELVEAKQLLEHVVRVEERTLPEDHPSLATSRQNLSLVVHALGDYQGARVLAEAALTAYERTLPEDHPNVSVARAHLGATMFEMGELEASKALFVRSLAVLERTMPPDHPDLLGLRANLASALAGLGEYDSALELMTGVAEEFERILPPDHPHRHRARLNLAGLFRRAGNEESALQVLEEELAALERILPDEHPDVLRARQSLAVVMFESGNFDGARELYEPILARYVELLPKDHPDLLMIRSNLASTYLAQRRDEEARSGFTEVARGMLGRARVLGLLSPREALAGVAAETERHVKVRSALSQSRPEDVALRFELAETLRHVALAPVRFDPDVTRELAPIRARLADLVASVPSTDLSQEEILGAVTSLSLERDRLERELRSRMAESGAPSVPLTPGNVGRALPEGSAAVGFLRLPSWIRDVDTDSFTPGPDRLEAHVVRTDGSVVEVDLGAADEIEELAFAWRESIGEPLQSRGVSVVGVGMRPESEQRALGQSLRERLLDPILARLEGETVVRLCRDDFVFAVPLDALPLADDVVGDRIRIVDEISFGRIMEPRQEIGRDPSLLAVGGVDFAADVGADAAPIAAASRGAGVDHVVDLPPLAETGAEAEAAAHTFTQAYGRPAHVLSGKDATKARFLDLAPQSRFLHLATHGWFAPETVPSIADTRGSGASWLDFDAAGAVKGFAPLTLCGLAFAGAAHGGGPSGSMPGILTAEELACVDLSRCELAVLSACETNVGLRRAGQGIQSLQAALHAAGARTAITSLWRVDDAATRRLMELFYTKLWSEGLGKDEALWRAKMALREEGHPVRDWAGWILSGAPD